MFLSSSCIVCFTPEIIYLYYGNIFFLDQSIRRIFHSILQTKLLLQNCDWENHPAQAIMCATVHGKYLVKRKGVDYSDYGLVDIAAAKRQCSDGSTAKFPVTVDMVNTFETQRKRFWSESHARMSEGALDLGTALQQPAFTRPFIDDYNDLYIINFHSIA